MRHRAQQQDSWWPKNAGPHQLEFQVLKGRANGLLTTILSMKDEKDEHKVDALPWPLAPARPIPS